MRTARSGGVSTMHPPGPAPPPRTMHPAPPGTRHPPVNRITHACENITLPQLRWSGKYEINVPNSKNKTSKNKDAKHNKVDEKFSLSIFHDII